MITRIVKMTFREEAIPEFKEIFASTKSKIRGFEGCLDVQLLELLEKPAILFTISKWESTMALDNYRKSDLFSHTWKRTKVLFSCPAEVWSLGAVDNLPQ